MENNLILLLDEIIASQPPELVEKDIFNPESLELDIILPVSIYNDFPLQNGLCGCNRKNYYIAKYGKVQYLSVNDFVMDKTVESVRKEIFKLYSGKYPDETIEKILNVHYFDLQGISNDFKFKIKIPQKYKDNYCVLHPLYSYGSIEKHITGGRSLLPYPKIKDIVGPYFFLYDLYMTTGVAGEVSLIYYSTKDGGNNEFTISFVPGDKYKIYVNGIPDPNVTANSLLNSANDLFFKIKTGQLPEPAFFMRYPIKFADAFLYYGIISKKQYQDLVKGEVFGDVRCTYCPFTKLCAEDAN